MTRPRPDSIAAVSAAQAEVDRLYERRDRAMEGAGLAPDPMVVRAAEEALERARKRMRKAVAA